MVKSVHTDAYAAIIAALVRARRARGITQTALGRRLGKPQSFISEIETRERRLDILEFYAVAQALGVDPRTLFAEVTRDIPDDVAI